MKDFSLRNRIARIIECSCAIGNSEMLGTVACDSLQALTLRIIIGEGDNGYGQRLRR